MSTLPGTKEKRTALPPVRTKTVVMGRQGFFSVILRLIGVELYKLRQRALLRVLIAISVLSVLLVFTIIGITAMQIKSTPLSHFMHTTAGDFSPAQASTMKQETLSKISMPLRLPGSLSTTTQVIESVGLVLVIILAGTIVGGEYSVGTVRLMFTRGPTRTQFILAKLGTIITCIFFGAIGLILLGSIVGAVFNTLVGSGYDRSIFPASWPLHAILYILVVMLQLFMYALLAGCLSILGRTTVAGVAGTLIWWVLENLLGDLLSLISTMNQGLLGSLARAIPNYFIGNNLNTLLEHQRQYLVNNIPTNSSDLHALFVLGCYIIVLTSLAWWVNKQRDVTN